VTLPGGGEGADAALADWLAFVMAPTLEGGFYDGRDKRDPNPTNHGVILKTLQRQPDGDLNGDGVIDVRDLRLLTVKGAQRIASKDYWNPARCPDVSALCPALAVIHGDWAYNWCPVGALKTFQRTIGMMPSECDGVWGPQTAAKYRAAILRLGCAKLCATYLTNRQTNYKADLHAHPWKEGNRHGWHARLNALAVHLSLSWRAALWPKDAD
jgi:lysozyme family protein